jgi:hypothetical protein
MRLSLHTGPVTSLQQHAAQLATTPHALMQPKCHLQLDRILFFNRSYLLYM